MLRPLLQSGLLLAALCCPLLAQAAGGDIKGYLTAFEAMVPLRDRLDRLVEQGQLKSYLALSQLIAPATQQEKLRQAVAQLPSHSTALSELGIPAAAIEQATPTSP